ncbi:MAG: hypothetical protein R2685_07855 [Candidatus Nitrosocosmicus sp.]|nr:hypothetical protein [Candidatus Nitrosocosmicus sp.]
MDIGLEANLYQLAILFAAFVGNFIATLPPFWKEKFKFAEYDIRIFFDYKFLGTAIVTGIGSFTFVSALMNTIDTQIPQDTTFVFALITAFTIGLLGNKGVNMLIPSPNREQKKELQQKLEGEVIEEHENQKMIAGLKLARIEEKAVVDKGGGGEKTNDSGTS